MKLRMFIKRKKNKKYLKQLKKCRFTGKYKLIFCPICGKEVRICKDILKFCSINTCEKI